MTELHINIWEILESFSKLESSYAAQSLSWDPSSISQGVKTSQVFTLQLENLIHEHF